MPIYPSNGQQRSDSDGVETREWIDSIDSVVAVTGQDRARFLLDTVVERASRLGVPVDNVVTTPYCNTIPVEDEPAFPGDDKMEKRIRRLVRWNAAVMVARANRDFPGLGGHISTYASTAGMYEMGFNHFFRGKDGINGVGRGDQIYFQGHASPGIYARAFLMGALSEDNLLHFRRECGGKGLSSYPHPRLMPDLWEFPTVSMGLGPLNAVYQARFNRYLHARGIADTSQSRVWAFIGDGESDEPETFAGLRMAAREQLDNLTFVVNCNLQRLDGPVRGNGKIIQELEGVFRGAGWNVIKVVWGREVDSLLKADTDGALLHRLGEILDGDYQRLRTLPGDEVRQFVCRDDARLLNILSGMSDDQIAKLRWGGHDDNKLHAAFDSATKHKGQPTVILCKTVKGWALGEGFEGVNATHQIKTMELEQLHMLRDTLQLPITDAEIERMPFYHPGKNSPEIEYMMERRRTLGGAIHRRAQPVQLKVAPPDVYSEFHGGTKAGQEVSTTMALVRLLSKLMKAEDLGKRIVPIIPDEARTFGMEPLFGVYKIYTALGQQYTPVDHKFILKYAEGKQGQILEEGITEAGAMGSFTAAGTSYAAHRQPMVPFYVFYSMFGFQRIGDMVWAFADQRGRGFLCGATAGRTTLNGEGLQHQDGHSLVIANTVPNCLAYDPAFAFESAVIVEEGLRRMVTNNEDVFYYITLYNEKFGMPAMPDGARDGILKGLYKFAPAPKGGNVAATLIGSGTIMFEVLRAQAMLANKYGVAADVWSATSYGELRRDALDCERHNRLHPAEPERIPYVATALASSDGPIVAASDYMKLLPDLVGRWMPRRFVPLGTDGFGRSDTRENLRRFFEVDAEHIVAATLSALARDGKIEPRLAAEAMTSLKLDTEVANPLYR